MGEGNETARFGPLKGLLEMTDGKGRNGRGGRWIAPSADPVVKAMGVQDGWKRPFDLWVVASAALLLLPLWIVLGVAIPLAIRLESPGPALYRQARLGRGGRVFAVLKFRTMVDGAELRTGPVWAAWRDARVTRVGGFLRRWRLDELPQVVNVLRGEMSLVGPRPERPELAARIEREVPGFAARLLVRPGIAGLAQARGADFRDPVRKLRYDLLYIETMRPWLDVKLLALCLIRVLGGGPRRMRRRADANPADSGGRAPAAARRP
ncbi:MAG: sugar transferase [Rhodospirillales bacterium]|nr:sugar transferase [Rhodospirillales bacterium]